MTGQLLHATGTPRFSFTLFSFLFGFFFSSQLHRYPRLLPPFGLFLIFFFVCLALFSLFLLSVSPSNHLSVSICVFIYLSVHAFVHLAVHAGVCLYLILITVYFHRRVSQSAPKNVLTRASGNVLKRCLMMQRFTSNRMEHLPTTIVT